MRTENAFDQRDKSPAKAVGLMLVTPEAGRDTAKRFGVAYDWNGLVSDPVYNTQMGAAATDTCSEVLETGLAATSEAAGDLVPRTDDN